MLIVEISLFTTSNLQRNKDAVLSLKKQFQTMQLARGKSGETVQNESGIFKARIFYNLL